MPSYAYRAVHASGRISSGEMAAANENELAHYLSESGLELIDAREAVKRAPVFNWAVPQPNLRILASFCARMHDLLRSGLSFADCLRDVISTIDHRAMSEALAQIARAISAGGGIACSFALYPRLFSPVFIAIIGAGERSGDMAVIFDFLARHASQHAENQEKLRKALRYPLFLLFVAGGAVIFMMALVVPQLVQFLASLQSHLPLSTRVLVALSSLFTRDGIYIGIGLAVAAMLIFASYRIFSGFALACDSALLRLPVIGKVILKSTLARFTHAFSILFRSGCEMQECLRQAGQSVGNRALRAGIAEAEQRVVAGAALSRALDAIMPTYALGLLRMGERSGDLAKSLDDITAAYEREAQAAMDHFIGTLEPCLTLAIGGLLAWTVTAVLGPLYGSLSVLGGRM